jgi:predicted outer membrane repeat protein
MSRAIVFLLVPVGLALGQPATADVVVGTGQPASCTGAAFASAVATVNASGGTITFNCGGAATITVTTQAVFQNSGDRSLVYAIDGGGLITLSGGGTTRIIYHTTGTLNLRNITFIGGRAQGADDGASGGAVRSDGLSGQQVFLNLTNVTFTGNSTNLTTAPTPPFSPFDYGGGALFTRYGIVTVTNCTFSNNTANNTSGGALHVRSSTVNITGSVFDANASTGGGFGGAIHVDGLSPGFTATGGTLQIATTSFTNNTSFNQGGAIFFYLYPERGESAGFNAINVTGNQVLDSSGTTYLANRAFGGGIAGDRGNVTIQNSTIANNRVHSSADGGSGGGLSLTSNGTVRIWNSTISNNRAEGPTSTASGGGLLISGNTQPFDVTHATIAFNFASWTGGGIQTYGAGGTLRNTIIAGNVASAYAGLGQQCYPGQLSNGGGVLEFPSDNSPCASGSLVADPKLAPLASNGGFSQTHLLQGGSPAIDAGACPLAIDQRWVARPQGVACDLGAVEIEVPSTPTNFFTTSPCRVVDTRVASGPTGGAPLTCGVDEVFTVTGGACGIPASAKAVAINVTVARPSAGGNLNVFPASPYAPLTSIVNYSAGQTRANNAVVLLNAGQVAVHCGPSGTAHVVIDVNGYFQ